MLSCRMLFFSVRLHIFYFLCLACFFIYHPFFISLDDIQSTLPLFHGHQASLGLWWMGRWIKGAGVKAQLETKRQPQKKEKRLLGGRVRIFFGAYQSHLPSFLSHPTTMIPDPFLLLPASISTHPFISSAWSFFFSASAYGEESVGSLTSFQRRSGNMLFLTASSNKQR